MPAPTRNEGKREIDREELAESIRPEAERPGLDGLSDPERHRGSETLVVVFQRRR